MIVDADRMFEAMDHAVARIQEFAGEDLGTRLAAVGLDISAVHAVLLERWELAEPTIDASEPEVTFTRGFLEGLLLGRQIS